MRKSIKWIFFLAVAAIVLPTSAALAVGSPTANPDDYDILQDSGVNALNWAANDDLQDFSILDSFDTTSFAGATVTDAGNGFFDYTPPTGFLSLIHI